MQVGYTSSDSIHPYLSILRPDAHGMASPPGAMCREHSGHLVNKERGFLMIASAGAATPCSCLVEYVASYPYRLARS